MSYFNCVLISWRLAWRTRAGILLWTGTRCWIFGLAWATSTDRNFLSFMTYRPKNNFSPVFACFWLVISLFISRHPFFFLTRLDVSYLSVIRFWLRLLISLRDRFKNRKLLWFCCNYVGEFCMFTVLVESEVSVGVMVSFVDMKFVWLIWQLGAPNFVVVQLWMENFPFSN